MNVVCRVETIAQLPNLEGAHEVAWSCVLDTVFADAHHRCLETLTLVVPTTALVAEIELRAALTPPHDREAGSGVALLAGGSSDSEATYVYQLRFGSLAPRSLRARNAPWPRGVASERHLNVFTLRARLLGVIIRAFALVGRPDLVDRAMFAMRRGFTDGGNTPAYYHLHIGVTCDTAA